LGDFGLSGTLTIQGLDYNSAAVGVGRLDWTSAFDLDGDGEADVLDPGAALPTPVGLGVGIVGALQFRVSGGVAGTTTGNGVSNTIVTAGPVTIGGSAEFALSRATVDVDTGGNGSADLLGATLDELALTVDGATVKVEGVATLTVSGQLALVRVT